MLSLFCVYDMVRVENENTTVELIIDEEELEVIDGYPEHRLDYFQSLKKAGLTSVAVSEQRLGDIIDRDSVDIISGNELIQVKRLTGNVNEVFTKFNFGNDSAFLITDSPGEVKKLQEIAEQTDNAEYIIENDVLTVFFQDWDSEYLRYIAGFDSALLSDIDDVGLSIVSRYNNYPVPGKEESVLSRERLHPGVDKVIFSGEEVTGYPNRLNETAAVLQENNYRLGIIEEFIASQKGAHFLASLTDFNHYRVHSIRGEEMEKYSFGRVVDRYLRAAKERNVRSLYLRPFPVEKLDYNEDELSLLNIEYVQTLSTRLEEKGFNTGTARPFDNFSSSSIILVLLSLGILAAGIILWQEIFTDKGLPFLIIAALIFLIFEGLLIIRGNIVLLRQFLALAGALIFPALAVAIVIGDSLKGNWVKKYIMAGLISFFGAVIINAVFADTGFISGIYKFRGVKLAFILPLIVVSILYFKSIFSSVSLYDKIGELLNREIIVKDVLILGLLFTGGIFYIGRTGNIPVFPVPNFEIVLRDLLEDFLIVRPRFKAFLFGHPFLLLALYYREYINKLWYFPLLILATVGQITIVNTFSHVHTPFKISLLRFFNGYWLGFVLGLILIFIIESGKKL